MHQEQINKTLKENHQQLIVLLKSYKETELNFALPGKWSAAKQAEHLLKSIRPVTFAFSLPSFVLKLMFGKANRPSRTFDALQIRYHEKLALGGRASSPFVTADKNINLTSVLSDIEKNIDKLARAVSRKSEKELDTIILPHPLLGKLTLCEMLYFTCFHVQHHEENIRNQLAQMNDTSA